MMNPTLITRRRLLIAMALSPLLWQMRGAQAADVDPQRVVALEWLPAELLLALGVTPYGVADIPNYRLWVNEPALPDSVIDVGLRTEPNLELLTQMKPSFIVWSAGYGPSPEKLARIAPGRGFTFSDGKRPLAMAQRSLLEMADLLGKTQQAKRHLAEFDALMESLRPRFAGRRRSSAADDLSARSPPRAGVWRKLPVPGRCLIASVLKTPGTAKRHSGEALALASTGWRHLTKPMSSVSTMAMSEIWLNCWRRRSGRRCPSCARAASSAFRRSGSTARRCQRCILPACWLMPRESGMNTRLSPLAIILLAGLLGVAFALSIVNLNVALPYAQWRQALWQPDVDDIAQMLFHYSLLPRLAVALLVGAGLGLVGVLFQQVLRNPLAEPTTLGVATGAQLGITVTTLWAIPGVLASQFAALAGACLVGALVFGVSWGKRLSPVTLILAGLVVSLYCGALNQLMVIFHHDQLQSMFLWSTGTLTQTDWSVAQRLWPQLLGGAILTLLLLRPLTLMGLDDGVARNLGLALSLARLGALTLAIVISALLVNAVGIIGFIGLFAPLLAKMLGARRLLARLLLAALIGALLLWLSDQVILWLSRVWREVSTGSVTALIGAPLLLWLLPRLRSISAPVMNGGDNVQPERYHVQWFVLAGVALLLLAVSVALAFGRDAHGWLWAHGDLLEQLLPWRWPRVLSALFAGVMLAVAGCIIQRLTGSPMASPEVLGISSGAAFGVVLMLFFVPGDAFGWLLPAGSLGAAATLLIIMLAAGRGGFSPHRMLLAGMALSTAFTMLLMMLQASGDPRMAQILTWISGSTYSATPERVVRSGAVMLALLALAPLCRRWLTILPLGGEAARAVGMALTSSRIVLLLLAACLTAAATLTIGPLSFVGLMAPHIARMMGFRRTLPHMVISGLTGGLLLVFADWCGRMMMFPYQIPAGLLSTFIGAPYFIYLLRKQSR